MPWIIFLVRHVVLISRNSLWGRHQSLVNYKKDMLVLGGNVLVGDSVEVESAAVNPGAWGVPHNCVSIISRLLSSLLPLLLQTAPLSPISSIIQRLDCV